MKEISIEEIYLNELNGNNNWDDICSNYKLNEKIFGNTYITDYKDFICLMDNGDQ